MVFKRAISGSVSLGSIHDDLGWQYSGQSVGRGWSSDSVEFGDNEIDGRMFEISVID